MRLCQPQGCHIAEQLTAKGDSATQGSAQLRKGQNVSWVTAADLNSETGELMKLLVFQLWVFLQVLEWECHGV